jgi:hypothetical protein
MNDYGNSAAIGGAIAGMMMTFFMIMMVIGLFIVVCQWKIFSKAGKPGWAAIIPVYNLIVLLDIVGKPVWWILLFFIPLVNFVVFILLAVELARSFGKGGGFAIGLLLLPIVFYPILAFDDSTYMGPGGNTVADPLLSV